MKSRKSSKLYKNLMAYSDKANDLELSMTIVSSLSQDIALVSYYSCLTCFTRAMDLKLVLSFTHDLAQVNVHPLFGCFRCKETLASPIIVSDFTP